LAEDVVIGGVGAIVGDPCRQAKKVARRGARRKGLSRAL
jgi:hypothetical protein